MARRPLAKLLMTTVAYRHFICRQTKLEIAQSLGISRFKVARLIEEAIESGTVRFVIADQEDHDTALSERLAQHYGLRHAVVVRGPDLSSRGVTEALGRAAAALLEETLVDGQTLAVAWGRTLAAAEYAQSSVDLVHRLAALSRGTAYPLYLPMWFEDETLVERLRSEPSIARATARFSHIDVLVSGIGAWSPPNSTLFSTLPATWQEQAQDAGTCADLCTVLIDRDGKAVATPLAANVLGVSAEQIRAIPIVIGVAGGLEKTDAIRAVLRGGWLTTLITDAAVAHRLMEEPASARMSELRSIDKLRREA
jgi:DNA-binding transcriptional regulator LsrR (DeoR family)